MTTSCTIRVDNEVYCIRDDGEWKDCPNGPGVDDLVDKVNSLAGEKYAQKKQWLNEQQRQRPGRFSS